MLRRALIASIVLSVAAASATSFAGAPLVVSVWGGNWKDTIERVVAKPYTAQTGIPVEFEVGGTLDRLAKTRVAKGAPLVDVTFTTSHVARLYASNGLLEKLDLAKLPASAGVPASLKGQPGVFATPAEWKERGYIIDDETRATLLPKWKEWFNADFVGASSVLTARATSGDLVEICGARIAVRLDRTLRTGETVRLLIRPERVALGSAGPNTIPARVSGVMYLGDHSEVRLELADGRRLVASVRGRAAVSAGERVVAHLPEDAFLETP
jgi:hypothetical protein